MSPPSKEFGGCYFCEIKYNSSYQSDASSWVHNPLDWPSYSFPCNPLESRWEGQNLCQCYVTTRTWGPRRHCTLYGTEPLQTQEVRPTTVAAWSLGSRVRILLEVCMFVRDFHLCCTVLCEKRSYGRLLLSTTGKRKPRKYRKSFENQAKTLPRKTKAQSGVYRAPMKTHVWRESSDKGEEGGKLSFLQYASFLWRIFKEFRNVILVTLYSKLLGSCAVYSRTNWPMFQKSKK